MKRWNRGRLRAFCMAALCAGLLCGCAPGIVPARDMDMGADPLAGVAIDPDTGVRDTVESLCSKEEIRQAAAALVEAGVLRREELEAMPLDAPASRAMLIRLAVGAIGAEVPARERFETWYAPFVKAGYAAGLFVDSMADMSFVPTDGFRMGERGYADMDRPITRYDAAAILARTLPAGEYGKTASADLEAELPEPLRKKVELAVSAGLLLPLEDGGFYGESRISNGQALVCVYQAMKCGARRPDITVPEKAPPVGRLLQQQRKVIHAAGRIAGQSGREITYTNSAEALVNAYRAGNRVIELDFMQTADGRLACIHKWNSSYAPQITDGVPITLAQWLEANLLGELTPLCLESLADFMRQHPDLYVVTDVKDDNIGAVEIIAAVCPDLLDRFVVQIYSDREYEAVRQAGISNIIYTLYNLSGAEKADTDHWVEFAAEYSLVGYAYPLEWFKMDGYNEAMKETGVPLFVHTVNGREEMEMCYDAGITAIYTDHTA